MGSPTNWQRRNAIKDAYKEEGASYASVGRKFGVSRQRVHQVVNDTPSSRKNKKTPQN